VGLNFVTNDEAVFEEEKPIRMFAVRNEQLLALGVFLLHLYRELVTIVVDDSLRVVVVIELVQERRQRPVQSRIVVAFAFADVVPLIIQVNRPRVELRPGEFECCFTGQKSKSI